MGVKNALYKSSKARLPFTLHPTSYFDVSVNISVHLIGQVEFKAVSIRIVFSNNSVHLIGQVEFKAVSKRIVVSSISVHLTGQVEFKVSKRGIASFYAFCDAFRVISTSVPTSVL